MRLVKKSVNQDDVSAYHLFYADGVGSPGTDLTFFDWLMPRERRGTSSIARTGLRVSDEGALQWWEDWLRDAGVIKTPIQTKDGRLTIDFEDPEGQRLSLVVDKDNEPPHPWLQSSVPARYQIRGLGPVTLSVPDLGPTERVLTHVLNLREVRAYATADGTQVHVFEMGKGGAAAELHVAVERGRSSARLGAGGVHHVAFRTTLAEYEAWAERLVEQRMPSSGPVDRYYFKSLYFREPNGILFEIATDEPGFAADEPLESLGTRLALPPFLEARRAKIEAGLKPIE
jgi:glyoxalase family protein